jgi:hypothetical protein
MIRFLGTLAVSTLAFAVGTQATAVGGGPYDQPLELRLAVHMALRTQYEGSFKQVQSGKDLPVQLLGTARELTEAELAAVVGRSAQVSALERAVARHREIEDMVARMVLAGRRPLADATLAATARREAAARLQARIEAD